MIVTAGLLLVFYFSLAALDVNFYRHVLTNVNAILCRKADIIIMQTEIVGFA